MTDQDKTRRFPRVPAKHTALVRTIDAEVEGFARTNSVSTGGCGILTRDSVEPGIAVEVLLTIEGRVVQVFGRTVYVRPATTGFSEVGVEFLDVMPEDLELLQEVLQKTSR